MSDENGLPLARRAVIAGIASSTAAATAGQAAVIAPVEAALWPHLPIVDAHQHLWDTPPGIPGGSYLVDDLERDLASGHTIVATVFIECKARYRTTGPDILKPVGEVEFARHAGDRDPRIARGIVGAADLMLGDAVAPVLEAEIAAGGDRFKGIRYQTPYDPNNLFGGKPQDPALAHRMVDPTFRAGLARLAPLGLSFDTWCFHGNLPDLADLAAAFPNTTIILDHIGTPLGVQHYLGRDAEVFADWSRSIRDLAKRPNVVLKFGGLGMGTLSPTLSTGEPNRGSRILAALWKPYFQVCVEAFGADRCMFESNFPVDSRNSSYGVLWNAFKRLAQEASPDERAALFGGAANRAYRLNLEGFS